MRRNGVFARLTLVLVASSARRLQLERAPGYHHGLTTDPKCGAGTGQKATGEPIKLGAIATKQPGTDFTDIPNMAKAYFDCVNDNGGINGRPIQYLIETEQTDPGQVAALAKKLVESDKVLGIVGNTSIIECAVNHGYYEQQGLRRHRLGHRARVLLDAQQRAGEHGPALQRRRRHPVPDP